MKERTSIHGFGENALEHVREELKELDIRSRYVEEIHVEIVSSSKSPSEESESETETETETETEDDSEDEESRDSGPDVNSVEERHRIDQNQNVVRRLLNFLAENDDERWSSKDLNAELDVASASSLLTPLFRQGYVGRDSRPTNTGKGWEYEYWITGEGRRQIS